MLTLKWQCLPQNTFICVSLMGSLYLNKPLFSPNYKRPCPHIQLKQSEVREVSLKSTLQSTRPASHIWNKPPCNRGTILQWTRPLSLSDLCPELEGSDWQMMAGSRCILIVSYCSHVYTSQRQVPSLKTKEWQNK